MTIPDSPALDLDALTALEQAVPAAPWRVAESSPAWGIRTEGGWELVYASYADSGPQVLAFIAAARNALPALLSALAAARAERDHYLRSFKAQQAENERVHGKVREQYDVIEHAKKQRDEAIEQAKQAQAERDEAWAWLPYEMRCTLTAKWAEQRGTTPAAATDDGEPEDPPCRCHPAPVPAGGEDGSGTADGEVPA